MKEGTAATAIAFGSRDRILKADIISGMLYCHPPICSPLAFVFGSGWYRVGGINVGCRTPAFAAPIPVLLVLVLRHGSIDFDAMAIS